MLSQGTRQFLLSSRTIKHPNFAFLRATALGRRFPSTAHYATSVRWNSPEAVVPNAQELEEVVPIVWTTHRLSSEQIAKVDAIFHKVLWLDIFETSLLNAIIHQRLGLKLSPKQKRALERQMDARALGGQLLGQSGRSNADAQAEQEAAAPKLVDLKLTGFDASAKIKVIKEVRAIAGLGLKEAKELVEAAPKIIQKALAPEAAEELKKKLEEIGAQIELV